jgi:hypothetical protein
MAPAWLLRLEHSLAEEDGTESLAAALVVLASAAGGAIQVEQEDVRGAARRALFLLSAGGDPERGLDLHGRAVSAMADDLRTVDRQLALEGGLRQLRLEARGLPHVSEAIHGLSDAPDIAWRAYAASLLAEELDA